MKLINGDSLLKLRNLPTSTIDAVVTDPPYGLAFMGKKWDYDVPSVELWREVFRVLKPGGHLLSFGGTRTYHRMVCAIEDAGFEIRDQVQWLYGSGFPKSLDVSKAIDKADGAERVQYQLSGKKRANFAANAPEDTRGVKNSGGSGILCALCGCTVVSPETGMLKCGHPRDAGPATEAAKQWDGWGTALKPANEPICLARKPLEKGLTVAENVLKWGTGAINIDGSRIGTEAVEKGRAGRQAMQFSERAFANGKGYWGLNGQYEKQTQVGRWPANLILDEIAAEMLDEQTGVLKSGGFSEGTVQQARAAKSKGAEALRVRSALESSSGGASRFFFIAKNSKDDLCQNQKDMEIVKLVALNSGCEEARVNSVLKAVRTSFKKDLQLLQCLDSMPDSKKCILIQDLALTVENSENIGTTEIIQSCLRLSGFAQAVTASSTQNLANDTALDFGPTRFIYQAKASKSERNRGLEGHLITRIEVRECAENMDQAASLIKDILESIPNLSIVVSGDTIMVTCPKECISTTRTAIQQITELKTLNCSTHLHTKEFTKDVASKEADGISLAEFVKNLKGWMTPIGISSVKDGLATDAVRNVIFKKLSSLKNESAWQDFTAFHPTIKPVRLMEYLIKLITPAKGIVLDPFMGSGTTGVACKNLGFEFVGIELSEEYFEIAKRRIKSSKEKPQLELEVTA